MDRKRIVLATQNQGKVKEIEVILADKGWEFLSLSDFPEMGKIVEDGDTFLDNALKKARETFQRTGLPTMADDSGLEVDALDGAPGVKSSRFAGENANDEENNIKLLQLMEGVPWGNRGAQFKCVVAFVDGDVEQWAEGICRGEILEQCRGEGGFGYDPLFYVPEMEKTFAQMEKELKNMISHRGIAFRKIASIIDV